MKVLNLGNFEIIDNQMDSNAAQRANYLDTIKINITKETDALDLYNKYKPDLILHEFVRIKDKLLVKNLDKVPCKTILLLEDEHSTQKGLVENFTDVIIPYKGLLQKCQNKYPNQKFHYVAHHINTNLYKPLNIKKDIDVLVYGNMNPEFYPERIELLKELKQSKLIVKELPYEKNVITGEDLVIEINKAKCALVTPAKVKYTVAKYFEIPACGTIPIGISTEESKEIFGDLFYEYNELMFADKLEFLLKNEHWLSQYKDNILVEKVKEYSLEKYKEKMEKLFEEIYDR